MAKTDYEEFQQFLVMTLADGSPEDVALPGYLYTETLDNQESVLQQGAKLFHTGKISHLLLIDNLGGSRPGYPGAQPWQKRLRELNIPDERVILIPFHEPVLHTLSESLAMAQFVQSRGWKKLMVIAPPFHLPRCFLSAVTAILYMHLSLRAYAVVGITQGWHKQAVHSQNVVQGLRKDLIVGELQRIKKYQRKTLLVRLASEAPAFLKEFLKHPIRTLRNIPTYITKGSPIPLVSIDSALTYLEWRDCW